VRPNLKNLAADDNPFADLSALLAVLKDVRKENRLVEWKRHPPTGPTVSHLDKYRVVKVILSFANWEGGFIIFGVEPAGRWVGLSRNELDAVDPAHITELVNSCIQPDIPVINYTEVSVGRSHFALIHVPPSGAGPHITTKQVTDKVNHSHVILARHGLYCRQGAKSDLATAGQAPPTAWQTNGCLA
jgi:predicted HTH transcriptional regulator